MDMKSTLSMDDEFDSILSLCENNPMNLLQMLPTLHSQYKLLNDMHFQIIEAYANIKLRRFESVEMLIMETLGKAVLANDSFFMVQGNLLLSLCYRTDPQKTQSYINLAEEYARAAENPSLLASCYAYRGDFYQYQNNYKLAEELHLQVQKLLKGKDHSIVKLRSLVSLANTNIAVKRYKKALQYLFTALETCNKEKNTQYTLLLYNQLAQVLTKVKRYKEAEEMLNESIQLCEIHGATIQKMHALFSLAAVKLESGRPSESLTLLDACSSFASEIKFDFPDFFLDLYNNYAVAYGLCNNIDEAKLYLDKATAIAKSQGDIYAIQEINLNASKMLREAKRYVEAKEYLVECIQSCKKYKLDTYLYEAMEDMAKLHYKLKEYPKCVSLMQKVQNDLRKQIQLMQDELREVGFQSYKDTIMQRSHSLQDELTQSSFIGISSASQKVVREALLAAQHPNVSVLITGESGTGKEVIANLIHQNSVRKFHAFVAINAAAIATGLVENELFGHKKGSFTGAVNDTKGLFQQANKGTLFIDEIAEMPMEFQTKLLRAIENRTVTPVGSSQQISFDCRIISSTNRDVSRQIKENQFRLDLFHRINTIEIMIPPLRNRTEDIPLLVDHFVSVFSNEFSWNKPHIHPSFIKRLQKYSFPGNVRELKNIIERLFILGDSGDWDAELVEKICLLSDCNKEERGNSLSEKEEIIKALIRCNGIQRDAAKELNMSNSTMTRRIIKYGLEGYTAKNK